MRIAHACRGHTSPADARDDGEERVMDLAPSSCPMEWGIHATAAGVGDRAPLSREGEELLTAGRGLNLRNTR